MPAPGDECEVLPALGCTVSMLTTIDILVLLWSTLASSLQ